jgi:hypothetical protein
MLASARRLCFHLSLARALAESTASAGDLLRSWKERALQVSECKQLACERYQACLSILYGTASTPQWQTPVYHRKSGRNSPAIRRQKRIGFTRIMNLHRCVRRSQSFHRLTVFKIFLFRTLDLVSVAKRANGRVSRNKWRLAKNECHFLRRETLSSAQRRRSGSKAFITCYPRLRQRRPRVRNDTARLNRVRMETE